MLLTCPSCQAEGSSDVMVSTNSIGWRRWSDGWGEGAYCSTETGLLVCERCGTVFDKARCMHRRDSGRHPGSYPPVPRFLLRQKAPEQPASEPDEDEPDWDPLDFTRFDKLDSCYGHESRWRISARDALASRRWTGEDTELKLRLQWWWDWNALSRPSAPSLARAIAEPEPDQEAMPEDLIENLDLLLALIGSGRLGLLAGDIQRRLGRFDEAIAAFRDDQELPRPFRLGQAELARQGKRCLVELVESDELDRLDPFAT